MLMNYQGGYSRPGHAQSEAHMISRMAAIGDKEGFRVVATTESPKDTANLKAFLGARAKDVEVVQGVTNHPWPEDSSHPTMDGSATMVHRKKILMKEQIRARLQRLDPQTDYSKMSQEGLLNALRKDPANYGFNGSVARLDSSYETERALKQQGVTTRPARTYVEGGNVIHMTRGDAVHAVVGKDSFGHNQALEPNRDDETLKKQMAADLGVKPQNMHLVEQPGEFHLDMAMASWGKSRMLLNDSVKSAQLRMKSEGIDPNSPQGQRITTVAEARRKHELRAKADLEKAGFEVYEVPGRIYKTGADGHPVEVSNFLNGEAGSNNDGRRYFITGRGEEAHEDAFVAALPKDTPVRIYFAFDKAMSAHELTRMGMINCLSKRIFVPN